MTLQIEAPLLLVGAGKMGGALVEGWLDQGLDPALLYVQDPVPSDEIKDLLAKYDAEAVASVSLNEKPAVIVLAVKPQLMDDVLPGLAPHCGDNTVILSIAAGRTSTSIASHFAGEAAVVRSMPNTPAAIGRGITAAFANKNVSNEQKALCDALLSAVGEVVWLSDEDEMDAVTAVSGSGPAYVFYLTECLAEAGIEAGLSEEMAYKLAEATVSGAGELMNRSGETPSQLRKNVTSPGGTTEAALTILMSESGLKPLLKEAVKAAAERARMLSSS